MGLIFEYSIESISYSNYSNIQLFILSPNYDESKPVLIFAHLLGVGFSSELNMMKEVCWQKKARKYGRIVHSSTNYTISIFISLPAMAMQADVSMADGSK